MNKKLEILFRRFGTSPAGDRFYFCTKHGTWINIQDLNIYLLEKLCTDLARAGGEKSKLFFAIHDEIERRGEVKK